MPKAKKVALKQEAEETTPEVDASATSAREKLEIRQKELDDLYQTLRRENINSISDLENKLALVNQELSRI